MYYQLRLLIILLLMIFIPYKLAQWYGFNTRYPFVIAFFVITFGNIAFLVYSSRHGGAFLDILHKVNMYWIGFLLFVISLTLLYALIGWLLPISSRSGVYAIFAISALLSIYASFNALHYTNEEIVIEIENLEEEFIIYHAPDVHLGAFAGKERSQKLINDINTIRPDIVIFNGDFIDSKKALTKENLAPFKETTIPLYFTFGNHDTYVGVEEIHKLFKENNIHILENEIIDIKNVQILGIDHINADEFTKDSHASTKKETVKSVLPTLSLNTNKPIIMAIHKPIGIPYMAKAGADLILCGHTHAGQLFPASLFAKLQFEYLEGLYTYENSQIYVSSGIGTFGPPMRLGTKAHASIIKLIPKKSNT